ncbi:MAG: hypothetical protein HC850_02730 [Rhodomicrobium sp.]|nr:hypothetical protein [Rhodomicrobium sp.]
MGAQQILQAMGLAALIAAMPFAAGVKAGGKSCVGECYEEVAAPSIHRTFKRRVEIERGVYEIEREPALYGWATRRVVLDDGIEWREKPAVYKTVKVRRHIKARTAWEKRWIDGRYVMCKVRVPGKTVWTQKQVMVSPAKRYKVRSKPVYGYVKKRILISQYKNITVYHRARYKYVREQVVIEPESTVWAPISK